MAVSKQSVISKIPLLLLGVTVVLLFASLFSFLKQSKMSIISHALVIAILCVYIFFSKRECPPTCGHIHNGTDSIALWKMEPDTVNLVPWFKKHQKVIDAADKKHDILVMTFFAKLNDSICCIKHALKAHEDKNMIKCEKDKMMSQMLAMEAVNTLNMFNEKRDQSVDVKTVEDILNTYLNKIPCVVGETNPLSIM